MRRLFIPLAAATLVLAGCASSPDMTAAPAATTESTPVEVIETTATPVETTAPPSTPTVSDRGYLVKTVGEYFGLSTDDGGDAMDGYVTGITVDPVCTSPYAQPSENGHFVKVDMEMTTFPELEGMLLPNADNWKIIAADGTTFNGNGGGAAAYSCLNDSEQLPGAVGPGETVKGSIVLDVPTPSGVVVFQHTGGGWEWAY